MAYNRDGAFALVRSASLGHPSIRALHWSLSPHNPRATEKGQSMRPLERLTWEAILDLLSTPFRPIPDARQPARVDSTLHDTLLSGLAMMFFQHPSLLAL